MNPKTSQNTADANRVGSTGGSASEGIYALAIVRGLRKELQERERQCENYVKSRAEAHSTLEKQREVIAELYAMALEHCKDRGWSKHPTIDKAHAILWPNNRISHAEDGASNRGGA